MKLKKMKLKEEVFFSSDRVVRGGSWRSFASFLRPAYRSSVKPSDASDVLGFRPFRSLK